MEAGTSLRYFSGEDCDHREYRRWKQWALNKMRTMDKLPEEARGSFLWTLLTGRALEVVEHLKESDYQVKGGEETILDLLDKRWPELDRTDEIGENIADVFALKAREGESIRQWCARSRECFDKCARKTGVKFPEEARGWILLNCSGMNEEQRAVCLARAQGELKFDTLSQSMRSCFPEYTDMKKRLLAATWREKRAELNMVQKGRKFSTEVLLVSSPGFAVLDSGCGKTIIGRSTLAAFQEIWRQHGVPQPAEKPEQNCFRFGNGEQEVSQTIVDLPVFLAGRPGYVKAAVVKGKAPLLLSRPALQKLQARLDFDRDRLTLFEGQFEVPLEVNSAGQYTIPVTAFPPNAQALFPAAPMVEPTPNEWTIVIRGLSLTVHTPSMTEEQLNVMHWKAKQHRQLMAQVTAGISDAELTVNSSSIMSRWLSDPQGMPSEIICDPHRANIADAFSSILEQGGATFKLTAADAHWQLGQPQSVAERLQRSPVQPDIIMTEGSKHSGEASESTSVADKAADFREAEPAVEHVRKPKDGVPEPPPHADELDPSTGYGPASATVKMTQAESEECCKLVLKARQCGVWDEILRRVRDYEDIRLDEAWLGAKSGPMSDGAKRLRDERSCSTAPTYSGGSMALATAAPTPSTAKMPGTPHAEADKYPPGISSLEQWGKCMVAFGKYKGALSYSELFEGTADGMAGYRAWCLNHAQSGSAALKDLVAYLEIRGSSAGGSQDVIPGSSIARTFKT
ncbi:unnamed protein product [Durusdinium trenchii]|uniref:Uncharacterized protein n=1 Tax=Durusdinium trenchii TaxID=1381693 RepID=A0ABP0PIT7_9DINO